MRLEEIDLAAARRGGGFGGHGSPKCDLFDEEDLLHFVTPGLGECGIMSCPLLVPESVMLFFGPPCCARHGSVLAIRDGYRPRVFFLDVSETEIVSGAYEERVLEAAGRILDELSWQPRAMFVCGTCIDQPLGTDLRALCAQLASEHPGVRFSELWMDPLCRSTTPPPSRMKQAIYRLLLQESDAGAAGLGAPPGLSRTTRTP